MTTAVTQPYLSISLLGEFSLSLNGKPISSLNGDRPITLLAYLLLHRQTSLSRQQLAFTLWPDSTDSQARANLRNLFFTLRQTLPAADEFLAADAMTLQWRTDSAYTLDVADFTAALASAKDAQQIEEKIQFLETAVSLYKGDLLLGNYDDWILPLREELQQTYLEALHQLLALYEQQQEYRAAMRVGQRLLQQDPLDETAYVQLMRLHALSGDRAGVRRLYDLCVSTLSRELDVEPGNSTQAAYEQLLRFEAPTAAVFTTAPAPPTPALSTASARPQPLPTPTTQFIGREAELAQVAELLADPTCRLLTIVGPGGMGKTRLALQSAVGHRLLFSDGVAFVSLAPLQDPQQLPSALAEALGLSLKETAASSATLLTHLQSKQYLIVLDNFEHLLVGVSLLSDILNSAPQIKLLVTSRQRLNLQEEWVFEIDGFTLPESNNPTAMAENTAMALFIQSARRAHTGVLITEDDYPAILEICTLVNGMPLGIELAASWVRLLSCAEIAAEIKRDLDFLQINHQNIPSRHRNLRAVFDHSWQLLSLAEQQLLRRLSIFRGSFGRDAAAQVASASLATLSTLADNSLLRRLKADRYSLHELIRQYAYEKLIETDEVAQFTDAHLTFLIDLVKTAEHEISQSSSSPWPARLHEERHNFWACMDWAAAAGKVEKGMILATSLTRYWSMQGQNRAASNWLQTQLQQNTTLPPLVVAQTLNALGTLAYYRGEFTAAVLWLEESIALAQTHGFEELIADGMVRLGMARQNQHQYALAYDVYSEALNRYRQQNNVTGIVRVLTNLGNLTFDGGQTDKSRDLFLEALELARPLNDPDTTATALTNLSWLAALQGEQSPAVTYAEEALLLFTEVHNHFGIAFVLEAAAGAIAYHLPQTAAQLFGAAAQLRYLYEAPLSGPNIEHHKQLMAPARQQLSESDFQLAWTAGEKLTLAEMVTAAQEAMAAYFEVVNNHEECLQL